MRIKEKRNVGLALLNGVKVLVSFALVAVVLAWIFGPQGWIVFVLAFGVLGAVVWFLSGLAGEDISEPEEDE